MSTPRFSAKLDDLPATLELVGAFDAALLATALTRGSGRGALAAGSGGSLVAAEFLARCRDSLGLGPTVVTTPMQVVVDHHPLGPTPVWLFSAGGDNPDVLAAARAAGDRGCQDVNLVTRNAAGAAAALVSSLGGQVHVVPVADAKDGYLATHSLLSMAVGLLMASAMISREPASSPAPLEAITRKLTTSRDPSERRRLIGQWQELNGTDTIIVAADPLLRPAACLLDTSLWEASLCPVQTTDLRNLAHGRHAWLHHRATGTVLLAMTGSASRPTWDAIERILPGQLRRMSIDYGHCGRLANILALIDGLALIEAIGEVLAIDPGKPGIGTFGRAMYDDHSLQRLAEDLPARMRHKRAAIARADASPPDEPSLATIGDARLHELGNAVIGGAVFDYDGTIVSTEGRFELPQQAIVDQLVRLHRGGVRLGIATGRGGSAGEDLRKVLPEDVLPSIIIGYYNGGYIRTADINIDLDPPAADPAIAATSAWLDQQDHLFLEKKFKSRPVQICVDMHTLRHPYRFALDLAACPQVASGEVRIFASGHSFDIIPASSAKKSVVEAVRVAAGEGAAVLCFGDSGASSGNDHALLSHVHGISVGEVCGEPNGCWSLFGGAVTGPEALLRVLSALVASVSGEIRLDVSSLMLDRQ